MAYKKKEKISLMLYYDYIEQFECLSDEQLRKLQILFELTGLADLIYSSTINFNISFCLFDINISLPLAIPIYDC